MKFKSILKIIKQLAFISVSLIVCSCEDVIDIEVPTSEPRLVIEASIDWKKGTSGNNQTVKLSLSTPYFDTSPSPVSGATVELTNTSTGSTYFFEDQNDGRYTVSNFIPLMNNEYKLEVVYEGETFIAEEKLISVPEFNRIEQSLEGGFDSEALEVTYYFDDPAGIENFYLSSFQDVRDLFPILEDMSDEFTDGNEMFNFYEKYDDDNNGPFQPGDEVEISLYGISKSYYNFISLLIEQNNSGGDPFSSLPAEIRGNCINLTKPDNYAFGFFRVSEMINTTYTFQ